MVGAVSGMITREQIKKIPEVVNRLFEKKYELGVRDCLTLIIDFFDGIGIDIPRKAAEKGFNGVTLSNYQEKWEMGECREDYLPFLETFTREIEPEQILPGDILIFEGPELDFWGIYLGFGNCIVCMEDWGARVMPAKVFKTKEIRRTKEWAAKRAA